MDFSWNSRTESLSQLDMTTTYGMSLSNFTMDSNSQLDNRPIRNYEELISSLLSDAVFNTLYTAIGLVSAPIIEISGVFANIINVFVFWNIGLNDSVTSSFFALSVSDMCYLIAVLFVWICFTLETLLVQQRIRFIHLGNLAIFYGYTILAISILITTYIAIQRCCCVVFPLKFKSVFTVRRNASIIVLICIVSVAIYLPLLANQGMTTYFDDATNSSWVGMWFSKDRKYIFGVCVFLGRSVIPIATQVMTVICMVLLTLSLRKSSKFRQSAASIGKDQSSENKDNKKKNSSSKEIQVVQAVTLVTLMFIVCNTPSVCLNLTKRFVPAFDLYGGYHSLFIITNLISDVMQYLNASLNIVVYYNFNSAYRNILQQRLFFKIH